MSKPLFDRLLSPFRSGDRPRGAREDELESIAGREQKMIPYNVLLAATRNFNDKCKLGEGGFGPVYKGTMKDGRVVAVKRLAATSRQGDKEFKNEAMLLSRVQHKNIVNLLGYCTVGGENGAQPEKLLVYEYIPKESLDKMLFDVGMRKELCWEKRLDIINGVARGLLYLHEDCHETIIHRDIKASNILLDEKWIPKIADFGMARLYPENQTHVQTRVAGTNGYMAPEYLMHGRLSTKADVYSFGVLVLELISGMKNSLFNPELGGDSLLEWAWNLHKKGESLKILDSMLRITVPKEQVESCVHMGLLCTQADPALRPDMKRVVVILSKKPSTLPEPARPGFLASRQHKQLNSGRTSSSTASTSSQTSTSASKSSLLSTSASNYKSYPAKLDAKSSRSSLQERHREHKSATSL